MSGLITQVGAPFVSTATLNPITITTQTGAQDGDLIVVFSTGYASDGEDGLTPPAGYSFAWPPVLNQSNSGEGDGLLSTWAAGFFLVGTPAATYTLDINPNVYTESLTTVCLRNVNPFAPIGFGAGGPTGANATSPNITWPALTTSVADVFLLAWLFGDDTALSATPAGYATQVNGYFNGAFQALFSNLQATAGSTGTLTATYTTTDDWNTILLPLMPATPNDVILFGSNF